MSSNVRLYLTTVKASEELDFTRKVIYLYSAGRVVRNLNSNPLSAAALNLLSFYFQFGYNSETKELAKNTFDLKPENINVLNYNLKEHGYLTQDPMKKKVKYLNEELQEIKDYLESCGNKKAIFAFLIDLEK